MPGKSPRNILITGASSGIGAALAQFYARDGVFLALSGRNKERLEEVVQACRKKGAEVSAKLIDVTDQTAMQGWVDEVDESHALDLVIANAGISGGTGGSDNGESVTQARNIFEVNLTGVLNTIEPVLPRMVTRQCGQIALMSSLASFSGWPGAPSYSASKGAVRLYGEALRGSMTTKGVKVNVICPGFIKTPMTDVNDYKMPFLMEVDKAATFIANGLEKNKGRIAFPWGTYLLSGFLGMLPHCLSLKIFSKLPEKP